MDFINDLSTDSVFELIKQYYRDEQGKELQIGSDEFAMASMMAYVCGVLVQKFNAQARQRYLATATGVYLDALGETFDIERPAPTHAVCQVTVTASSGRSDDVLAPAGTFFISDNNGVKFKNLADIAIPRSNTTQTLTFIGVEDKANVLAENNLDIGTITTILTPVAGIVSVSNSTVPVGAADAFPDTDEGDDAYWQYILQKRSGVSTGGPAPAKPTEPLLLASKRANASKKSPSTDSLTSSKPCVMPKQTRTPNSSNASLNLISSSSTNLVTRLAIPIPFSSSSTSSPTTATKRKASSSPQTAPSKNGSLTSPILVMKKWLMPPLTASHRIHFCSHSSANPTAFYSPQ